MRSPAYYLTNCFNAPDISLDELAAFSTDALGRLGAQNGSGDWTDRIAALSPKLAALDGAYSDDLTAGAAREARKKAKNDLRKALPAQVDKVLSFVRAHFGKNSPELVACAPDGVTALRQCPDDAVKNHLDRLVNGVTAVAATVGAAVVTLAEGLKTNWMAIYTASEDSASAKTLTEEEQRTARQALQKELFLTLLAVAAKHIDEPEKLGLYMQPHLLGYRSQAGEEPDPGGGGGNGTASSSSSGGGSSSSSATPPPPPGSPSSSSSATGISSSSSSTSQQPASSSSSSSSSLSSSSSSSSSNSSSSSSSSS